MMTRQWRSHWRLKSCCLSEEPNPWLMPFQPCCLSLEPAEDTQHIIVLKHNFLTRQERLKIAHAQVQAATTLKTVENMTHFHIQTIMPAHRGWQALMVVVHDRLWHSVTTLGALNVMQVMQPSSKQQQGLPPNQTRM